MAPEPGVIDSPKCVPRWAAGSIRPMGVDDLAACADVFYAAVDELYARNTRPLLPRNPASMMRLFGHLLETDPLRCHVAETASGVVAFGIAHRRGSTWFLSFLFVRPEHQSAGLGRDLTLRCLAVDEDEGLARAVCAESIQPVSLALYTSLGMAPCVPLFLLTGRPRSERPMGDSLAVEAVPFAELAAADHRGLAAAVGAIDVATLGYEHPQDHRFWTVSGRQGWLFRDRASGDAVGYGYAHASGRIGPVATKEPGWLEAALAHLFGAVSPSDAWQLHVPGPNPVLPALLREGFRFDDAPILWCATSDGPAFDRYLVGSFAIL